MRFSGQSLIHAQDFIVSVLEASATRRDAKGYLQKYAPPGESASRKRKVAETRGTPDQPYSSIRVVNQAPKFIQGNGNQKKELAVPEDEPINLAIVKMTLPQDLDDQMLGAIAKTFSQLRKLGLVSIIVLDGGSQSSRKILREQSWRIQQAVEVYGEPGSLLLDQCVAEAQPQTADAKGFMPSSVYVQYPHMVLRALQDNAIVVIPPVTMAPDMKSVELVDADETIVALTKYFCGLQFNPIESPAGSPAAGRSTGAKVASVEKVIILDPAGGTPLADENDSCHRYINLEQEFEGIMYALTHPSGSEARRGKVSEKLRQNHARNLQLARNVLAMLPSTSSAIISTPSAAANKPIQEFTRVTTRNRQNPLIHNLLTDKPVFSSSLPIERVRSGKKGDAESEAHVATLIKRGMPLTVYPDPTISTWLPPRPGAPRLRLTDTCIDLPRLVHLINDSFNRELDVQHYLDRVNDNLAGIIIAGEYEGGAILTWEKPFGLDEETAYKTGRLVPYLDKFAVLKSRQGSGGVADVVFNAMVRGCFPEGVCWRSRQDNPVNKWYFERSLGTWKLKETNWTMFWTTPHLPLSDPKLLDYEDVCRHIEPSWADTKPPD
ncbi:acetylglutamate synthase [Colletotrichum karsti]|uniref:Amino-acid acetyltransferase, mitochondrial n=1 Tax=Colletotrichum karsti TaxID=1095194 RepID=A0A9P6LPP8_9PEZI|nr:acetylglutamate synthase [Colletotrichum karsti]KAF9881383.1 acetylglutamate synthase [Colletotrichum karsti]